MTDLDALRALVAKHPHDVTDLARALQALPALLDELVAARRAIRHAHEWLTTHEDVQPAIDVLGDAIAGFDTLDGALSQVKP